MFHYILKKMKRQIKEKLQIRIPVNVPVLYGELLKGRVALITGGTSGIGYAMAEAFLRNGAVVIITGRKQTRIDKACIELRKDHLEYEVYGVELDNRDIDNMNAAFEKVCGFLSNQKIDIFVNNAGVINKTFFGSMTEADYDLVMDTDLKGPFFLAQLVSKYMINNKIQGNILNVSSSSALRPAVSSYGLAKWGINGMTLGLAKYLSRYGIIVNSIAPGPTATSMLFDDGIIDLSRPKSPSERFATAEEIANLAVILVSDLGRMINGDTVYATGGCGVLTFDD